MSEDRSQQEPSMEEILASIRKIIAEDGDAERRDSAPEAEEPEGESESAELDAGDDVLELTEESEEEALELTDPVEEQTEEEPLAPLQDMEMPLPPPPPPPPSGVQEEEIELIAEDEESEPVSRPESTRSEEHTSELQSLMRISYAVFCLKNNTHTTTNSTLIQHTS